VSSQKTYKSTSKKQPSPQSGMKKPPISNRGRWLGFGLGLAGVAMLSATAGAFLAVSMSKTPLMQQKLTAEEAAVFSPNNLAKVNMKMPELTRPVNILVLGLKVLSSDLDQPPKNNATYLTWENSFKGLTDTMMLLRFDPQKKKLTVLSIPRDTRTNIEGKGLTKINEANYYGGPALAAKSVSGLLGGVGIDRYVVVNIHAMKSLIDVMGGVDFYVQKDMKYIDESQHLYIDLKAGKQKLNGAQVVQFLLYRHDDLGDIGRVQRQQLLMRALSEQFLNFGTLSRLPQILSVIQSHIDTNLSIEELVALLGFAVQTQKSDVQMVMVPGTFSDPKEFKASYWLPDQSGIETVVAEHFDFGSPSWSNEAIDPSYLRVSIQNSTKNDDSESLLVNKLNDGGYQKVRLSKPWPEPLEVTRIVAQSGNQKDAEMIQKFLGFGEVVVESTGALQSDVTIKIGQDWLQKMPVSSQLPSSPKSRKKR
jgi:polyisoprenyl-teichoic acid--peptidoglycan teichoic acid transferase